MHKCEYELYHHGIKGMKWGVRKKSVTTGKRKKSPMSEDAAEVSRIRKKNVSQMSNAELRKANERIQLEQNYSRLNPSTVQKGMKFVKGTAAVMGTVMTLYNNSDKIVKLGKTVGGKVLKNMSKTRYISI